MHNQIYLKHKNKIILKKGTGKLSKKQMATLLINIESLGFTFSHELLQIIESYSNHDLSLFYKEIVDVIKYAVGAHVSYSPIYPNFPEQVMNASMAELYMNAFMHYYGDAIGVRILPFYLKIGRAPYNDVSKKLTIVDLGTKEDFDSIFTQLLTSKTSITATEKEELIWFIKNRGESIINLFPKKIPLKENIAIAASALISHTEIYSQIIPRYAERPNDVLRLTIGMSGGDVSLATNTKFKNFSKKERRFLISLLENTSNLEEDFLRYREKWLRLGEKLHPGDFKNKYPRTFEAFDVIRKEKKFETFNSKIEKLLILKDIDSLLSLLQEEPGQFCRRLDHILRISSDSSKVIKRFKDITYKVSSSVLLQTLTWFKHRNNTNTLRIFFPKGEVSKVYAKTNNLNTIPQSVIDEVILICEQSLMLKYSKLSSLGKVFIDENLKNFTVPFSMRSTSRTLHTLSRGSKLNLPLEANTLRFFLYWQEGNSRADIDLSATGLDDQYNFKSVISYYNIKDIGGYHSGDITSAPKGASEFIDININEFLKQNIRYVVVTTHSFTNQPFFDLPECFVGYMARSAPQSGEIFEPKSVSNKIDLSSDTRISIVCIIDLVDRQVLWADLALKRKLGVVNNVHANLAPMSLMARSIVELQKPDLYTLFELHAKARGVIIDTLEDADTVFSVEKGITPYNTLRINSEFL